MLATGLVLVVLCLCACTNEKVSTETKIEEVTVILETNWKMLRNEHPVFIETGEAIVGEYFFSVAYLD